MSLPLEIIKPVRLAPGFVANEDDLQPPEIELGEVGTCDLHVRNVAKHSEMMYHWLLTVLDLMWHLPIKEVE